MRIGMISQWLGRAGGGVSEAMRKYGDALRARAPDCELHVFAPVDQWTNQDRILYAGWTVHVARAFGPSRFPVSPGLVRELIRADLDVLHVHGIWQGHALAALLWHLRTGRPVVVAPHGMIEPWILSRSRLLKRLVSVLFQHRLFRRASAIQALTERERAQSLELYPENRSVVVVPNYVDADPPHPDGMPPWWREAMGERRIFLFLGRIHSKKSVVELCAAWERACEESVDIRDHCQLVFCGWIDDVPELPEHVEAISTRFGNILYAGPQFGDDKWRSYAAADLFVLPSRSEGLPMAVLEGWSMGKPAILTPDCNLEAGYDAGAAFRCDATVESIRDALVVAAREPASTIHAMGERARALVRERFTRDLVADQLLSVYRAAISSVAERGVESMGPRETAARG